MSYDFNVMATWRPDNAKLNNEQIRLKQQLRNLEQCATCLEIAQSSVDAINGTAPFKVLGITADNAMFSTMVSITIGFFSTLFSLISKSKQQFLKSEGI